MRAGWIKSRLATTGGANLSRPGVFGLEDLDLRRNMISLTACGKDLVEGSIPDDPGVIIYG